MNLVHPNPRNGGGGHENLGYEDPHLNDIREPGPNGHLCHGSMSLPESDITVTLGDSDVDSENLEVGGQGAGTKSNRVAILVQNAKKRFGRDVVLNGLCMTVEEGTIYGLLGSSGCGKTTILSAIVGLRRLDEGRISIFGKSPGSAGCGVPGRLVGYMPQEIALNTEFTMDEVCQYFGRLYGMTKDQVQDRVETLVELLDLKKCRGQLSNFSGGQKRRASFLVALLHEPDLLILDEPTVGVDPILRAKIWDHIRHLSDVKGTTIIITTHYIEEMRQAGRVAIMRGGQLMAEASPKSLLTSHRAQMLEEVVLKYCLRTGANEEQAMETVNPIKSTVVFENGYFSGLLTQSPVIPATTTSTNYQTSQIHRIRALTQKNIVVILRNVGFLLFLLMVPSLIVGFFSVAIGKEPRNVGLGFVTEESCDQVEPLECKPIQLSCTYLEILRSFETFKLKRYPTVDKALKGVEDGKVWGYVDFSRNFSNHVIDRTLGVDPSNVTIQGAKIRVRLDMSTVSTGQVIKKLVLDAYRSFSLKLSTACGVDITGRDIPVEFDNPIYGQDDWKYTFFLVPGVVVGFLPFLSLVACALSYIIEKKDGMMDRSKVAGVTALDIMLSHALPQFGIIVAQAIVAFSIMYVVDIPLDIGSPVLALVLTIAAAVTGMAIGFAAAEMFDQEKNAMMFALATMFPSFLMSGILWPLESFPSAVQFASWFLPATFPGLGIRAILFRGWGMSYFDVYFGFISQFIFTILFMGLTFIVHKIRS